MGLFNFFRKKPKIEYEYLNCHIDRTGYEKAIDFIPAHKNSTYELKKKDFINSAYEDEKEYEYNFICKNPKLIPEKDSQGKTVIAAIIADQTVGYIKKGSISRISNLLKQNSVVSIEATITGGKYKVYTTYYSYAQHKDITDYDSGKEGYDIIFTLKLFPTSINDNNKRK